MSTSMSTCPYRYVSVVMFVWVQVDANEWNMRKQRNQQTLENHYARLM